MAALAGPTALHKLVFPARFELTAPRLGIWCSIQLSYGNKDARTRFELVRPEPKSGVLPLNYRAKNSSALKALSSIHAS